jgi:hypothetical protein
MGGNHRFVEYTTSGAFSLNLTRNQVHSLGMCDGGSFRITGTVENTLERKGLIETIAAPDKWQADRFEFRPTFAGLLTLGLLREAGLTNGPADAVADEFNAMRAELKRLREENADLLVKNRSALARKQRAEHAFQTANSFRRGRKPRVSLALRDPIPEASDSDLLRTRRQFEGGLPCRLT